MMGRLAALFLLSTLSLIQTAEVPHQISLTPVELGGTFDKIQLQGQFNNSRFNITKRHAQNILYIKNVTKEDEATYFCQAGSAYKMEMIYGTLLVVNDHTNLKKSIHVKQSPKTESVQPGDSVTLQCSLLSKNKENAHQCPDEHNVYWFRSGSGESHPSILYTHSEEQKERSCVFSLSKTIHNSSDTGTYYCAVATCGQILFGEGTTVETRTVSRTGDVFLLLPSVVSAISVIVIAILIHAIKRNKCDYCHNKAAVYLQGNVAKRNVKRNEDPWIYSTVVFTVMETGPGVYTAAKAF